MACIEELYEQPPIEIEMTGGHRDGTRMLVPDDRDTWLMPVPVDPMAFTLDVTEYPAPVETYRRTGSIRDDGTRVYRYAGRC